MTGSWAGAMGHTQFIPTTYEAYAVDFDGDGRRDIWNSPADALASTANYLHKSGWVSGATWGYEVALPQGFNYRLAEDGKSRTAQRLEEARRRARARRRLSAAGRQGRAARAGRCERPGLPDAQEPLRHQALQQLDRLCARRRPPGRPAARRRRFRAVLAERRAAADRRRSRPNCSSISPRPAIMTARSTASSDRRRARRSAPSRAGAGLPPTALPACSSWRPCGAAEILPTKDRNETPAGAMFGIAPRSGARGAIAPIPPDRPCAVAERRRSSSRRTIPGRAGSSAASSAAIAASRQQPQQRRPFRLFPGFDAAGAAGAAAPRAQGAAPPRRSRAK